MRLGYQLSHYQNSCTVDELDCSCGVVVGKVGDDGELDVMGVVVVVGDDDIFELVVGVVVAVVGVEAAVALVVD